MKERTIIVGGGAGGMTLAVQLAKKKGGEVLLFDRSERVAWAGCPTPYWIAGKLPDEACLGNDGTVFAERGVNVYTKHEVTHIDWENKKVSVKGDEISEKLTYDTLILSQGGSPVTPPWQSYKAQLENVFSLSHADDAVSIKNYIKKNNPKKAVVVGAGFIGLEMAETFSHLGVEVTLLEAREAIFSVFNPSLLEPLYREIEKEKVNLKTSVTISDLEVSHNKVIKVKTDRGDFDADIVMLCISIAPNYKLLEKSNFPLTEGKLIVNEKLETEVKDVYALGDAVFTKHSLTGKTINAPFGDVANKQALILARVLSGQKGEYKGTYGAFATSFGDVHLAGVGLNESSAVKNGFKAKTTQVRVVTKHAKFADVTGGVMDVIYEEESSRVLGAFMVGDGAVAQFIDLMSLAILNKNCLDEVIHGDFCYSPTNSSVWNPLLASYRRVVK